MAKVNFVVLPVSKEARIEVEFSSTTISDTPENMLALARKIRQVYAANVPQHCGDCSHFGRCSQLVGAKADWQNCDWDPSRFHLG